jgi:hypothetical protein
MLAEVSAVTPLRKRSTYINLVDLRLNNGLLARGFPSLVVGASTRVPLGERGIVAADYSGASHSTV